MGGLETQLSFLLFPQDSAQSGRDGTPTRKRVLIPKIPNLLTVLGFEPGPWETPGLQATALFPSARENTWKKPSECFLKAALEQGGSGCFGPTSKAI